MRIILLMIASSLILIDCAHQSAVEICHEQIKYWSSMGECMASYREMIAESQQNQAIAYEKLGNAMKNFGDGIQERIQSRRDRYKSTTTHCTNRSQFNYQTRSNDLITDCQ